jgi:hypothetical protein
VIRFAQPQVFPHLLRVNFVGLAITPWNSDLRKNLCKKDSDILMMEAFGFLALSRQQAIGIGGSQAPP